ncbi:hypothetical protein ACFL4C_03820 [Candidatus Omnitrophota bacterium]
MPQPGIAQRVGVDQSTVSLYASSFRLVATEVGLLAAGKEFNVFEEVSELRSLSVELLKVNLTTVDAQRGLNILRAFHRMGVEPEQHTLLIKVCKEVRDPYFVKAAIELTNIENTTGMNFHQAIERLQEVSIQLPPLEDRIEDREKKCKLIEASIKMRLQEQADLDRVLSQSRKEAEKVIRERKAKLSTKMKQLNVKEIEANEVAALKAELTKKGLNLHTILKLAKEF